MVNKDKKENKGGFDIKGVKKEKIEIDVIKCPVCSNETESLSGYPYDLYLEDKKIGVNEFDGLDSDIEEKIENGVFYPCYNCSFIFPKDRKRYWHKKEIEALLCPKCNILVPKTQSNFTYNGVGYLCPTCHNFLEYCSYPHHGSCDIELKVTTDYFHGVCPKCRDGERYGMMVLGEQIWVECGGKVVLPLVCKNCGYRDAVKIASHNRKNVKILTNPPWEPDVEILPEDEDMVE